MRTGISILLAAGLIATLGGCAGTPEKPVENVSADCAVTKSGDVSDSVEVSGKLGAKPEITIDAPLSVKKTERTLLVEGDGDTVEEGQQVTLQFSIVNGASGEELSATGYTDDTSQNFTLDEQFLVGLVKTLTCSKVGSRVVGVIPPADSWGSAGNAELGVDPADSIVFVADVIGIVPERANGVDQPVEEGFPTVKLAKDGAPTVTIPKEDPPKELKLTVLKKGDGKVVADGATVSVQYQGINWRTGEVFDQSWGRGVTSFPTTGVIAGFAQAMVGQPVGSQVLVIIPPDLGYGPQGGNEQAGIKKDDTLVFVVDILATT